jgi:hypothetical protein
MEGEIAKMGYEGRESLFYSLVSEFLDLPRQWTVIPSQSPFQLSFPPFNHPLVPVSLSPCLPVSLSPCLPVSLSRISLSPTPHPMLCSLH